MGNSEIKILKVNTVLSVNKNISLHPLIELNPKPSQMLIIMHIHIVFIVCIFVIISP